MRQQALLDRGRVEVGEQDDQAALPGDAEDGRRHQPDVRLDQVGFEQRHLAGERRQHLTPARADDPGAHSPVGGDQVGAVTGPDGNGGEQQRRVHGGVEPRDSADPPGRGAARVEHNDDPPVTLGPPGPHDDIGPSRRRPPVDRPHVVAENVRAERIEL